MALIVEDGSGKDNATSYCDVAFADAYHADMGNSAWEDIDAGDREIYLRRAMAAMTQLYRMRWKGMRVRLEQALDWPRHDVVFDGYLWPIDEVPTVVKQAQCELALRAASESLIPDLEQQVLSESVGSVSVTYDRSSPQGKRYRAIELMLQPLLQPVAVRLVRA